MISIDFQTEKTNSFEEFLDSLLAKVDIESKNNIPLKIDLIAKVISLYKSQKARKDELTSEINNLHAEIESLKNRSNSATDLVKIKERIDYELTKFGQISSDTQLESKTISVKQTRISTIVNLLRNIKDTLIANNSSKTLEESLNTSHFPVLYLIVATFLVIIVLFVLTANVKFLVLGVISILINIFIMFGLRNTSYPSSLKFPNLDYENYSSDDYENIVSTLNKKEDEFLVNAAWVYALRSEKSKIESAIKNRLGGNSFEGSTESIEGLEILIENKHIEINRILDSAVSAELYLKLRRQQDILKIEAEQSNESLDTLTSNIYPIEITLSNTNSLDNVVRDTIMNYVVVLKQSYVVHYS